MLTAAQGKKQRKQLMAGIAREERAKQRRELAHLVAAIREARANRREALRDAVANCRAQRLLAREKVEELKRRRLAELRAEVLEERTRARESCALGITAARALSTRTEQAKGKLEAERKFRRDMARINRGNAARRRELTPRRGRRETMGESDDAIRSSIPHELIPLFERVKRGIKATAHMSRLEAFFLYAENHPDEVLVAMEDRTDTLVRELEAKERAAREALSRRRRRSEPREDAPF
jgi:hypothetical protein